MKYLVILLTTLLVLLVATGVTLVVRQDPGFAALSYGDYRVETTLAFLIGAAIAAGLAVYFVLLLAFWLWRTPGRLSASSRRRRAERARRAQGKGLLELAEGRWEAAERLLTRHAPDNDNPLINYLGAARAAQQLGAHDRRDEHLKLAHESTPGADVAVGLTQAELQLAHQQFEQALATLSRLHSLAPRHAYALKLLARLYEQLHDWEKLAELLPELRRRRILPDERLDAMEHATYAGRLQAAAKGDAAGLSKAWEAMPKRLREDPELFRSYLRLLHRKEGGSATAEQLLRVGLERRWDEELVELYGDIELADPNRQLQYAEGWLKQHGQSAALLRTLGRLCVRNRIWGKARSYFDASIAMRPGAAAYMELGELLEQHIGDPEAARDCYRKGLELALERAPASAAVTSLSELADRREQALLTAPGQSLSRPAGSY